MRISLKIKHFGKTYSMPRNDNIDQTLGRNIKVHHSRFQKSNFIFMIHHHDVINMPIYKGISKMNLTHHSSCIHSIRFFFWNSSTRGKTQGVWMIPIHRIISEGQEISRKSKNTIWHTIWRDFIKNLYR